MIIIFFLLLGLRADAANAATHSLMYFYTATRGIPHFPDFVTLGAVDGQPISYYDSLIRKESPRQDWMARTEGPEYWTRQTQISVASEQRFKASIDIVKQRLNQSQGVHVVQNVYGCEWDDETEHIQGFNQFGYNGEDYLTFDLETQTWIAPKQQAVITKMKWDRDQMKIDADKDYLVRMCVYWLKKYINDGSSSLQRKDFPSVSLLQKSSSSPISCHATGFYPDRARLFWTKDGEEVQENVEPGEILPNHDGTFQTSVDLDVSSVKPEDWEKYSCVFQLSGVKDIFTKLDKTVVRTNETNMTIIIAAVVVGLCVGLVALLGFVLFKMKKGKRPPSPVTDPEVEEELNPRGSQ